MWILTQNRERILSTEALDEIRVAEPAPGKSDFAIMMNRKTDRRGFALGFYHRKENAIAILQDILKTQGSWYRCDGESGPMSGHNSQPFGFIPPKTYTMPADDR